MLFQPGTHPGNKVTIDVNLLENLELLKALLMNLFADLKPQMKRELLYKLVQTLIARLCIVLKSFANIVVEARRDIMLLLEFSQVEKLFLQLCLLVVVIGED